jgi:hypothetical protein
LRARFPQPPTTDACASRGTGRRRKSAIAGAGVCPRQTNTKSSVHRGTSRAITPRGTAAGAVVGGMIPTPSATAPSIRQSVTPPVWRCPPSRTLAERGASSSTGVMCPSQPDRLHAGGKLTSPFRTVQVDGREPRPFSGSVCGRRKPGDQRSSRARGVFRRFRRLGPASGSELQARSKGHADRSLVVEYARRRSARSARRPSPRASRRTGTRCALPRSPRGVRRSF